jgi:uncharacterized protein (DUF1800 family)
MNEWQLEDAAHLLRRAGFGGSLNQVETLHAMGREGAIQYLLNYENLADPAADEAYARYSQFEFAGEAINWLFYRMVASTRPLQEKLTWFWHGHFTSGFSKCPPPLLVIQNETWRAHAGGRFLDFLLAMYKDAAMLLYLDGATSVVGTPNENFARELMELFTLGIGHYTETDVQEAARAFTGWTLPRGMPEQSIFVPENHDWGDKTVLGYTGPLAGDAIMKVLAAHSANAPFICEKLLRFFVTPEPAQSDIDTLAATWQSSDGDIKAVIEHLFHLASFWARENRRALVKSPVEFTVGLAQRFELDDAAILQTLTFQLNAMGQTPFNPPHVAGYPENLEWAGTSSLLARYNAANGLVVGRASAGIVALMSGNADITSPEDLVDTILYRMGPMHTAMPSREALLDYVGPAPSVITPQWRDVKTRGVLHLIASTPAHQLN